MPIRVSTLPRTGSNDSPSPSAASCACAPGRPGGRRPTRRAARRGSARRGRRARRAGPHGQVRRPRRGRVRGDGQVLERVHGEVDPRRPAARAGSRRRRPRCRPACVEVVSGVDVALVVDLDELDLVAELAQPAGHPGRLRRGQGGQRRVRAAPSSLASPGSVRRCRRLRDAPAAARRPSDDVRVEVEQLAQRRRRSRPPWPSPRQLLDPHRRGVQQLVDDPAGRCGAPRRASSSSGSAHPASRRTQLGVHDGRARGSRSATTAGGHAFAEPRRQVVGDLGGDQVAHGLAPAARQPASAEVGAELGQTDPRHPRAGPRPRGRHRAAARGRGRPGRDPPRAAGRRDDVLGWTTGPRRPVERDHDVGVGEEPRRAGTAAARTRADPLGQPLGAWRRCG